MRIKELFATFGSLDNRQLSLKDGLNIVHGRNEAGKSTWGAFIRAMLYGISTREKAKAGYIPDKERYLPWNGSPMYGKCTLISGGDEISIERTSGKSGVFSKVEAKNLSRGGAAPTGEELCGIARGVYDRCAFIGQAKLDIDRDADTEKRILSLASSGEETVSVREVISRLEKSQRLIRSPRGLGTLCELEKEIAKKISDIEYAKSTADELARTEESLAVYAREEKALLRAIEIARAEEKKNARLVSIRAEEALREAEERIRKYDNYPTKADYELLSADISTLNHLSLSEQAIKATLAADEQEYENAVKEISESRAFAGMNLVLARERAKADTERLEQSRKRKVSPAGIISLCAALLLAGGSFAMYMAGNMPVFAAGIACSVCFAVAGFTLLLASGKREMRECIIEITERYGGADRETIEKALFSYSTALSRVDDALGQLTEKREAQSELSGKLEFSKKAVTEMLLRFGIDAATAEDGKNIMKTMADEREAAYTDLREARIRADAINSAQPSDEDTIEYTEDEIPASSLADLTFAVEEKAAIRKNFELALAALRERLSGVDISRAESELDMMHKKVAELTRSFDAFSLAIKCIGEADAELSERFSPEVEKRTSEIFSALTGGSFEVVRIRNRDFDMDVATGVASARRDGLFLSRGTLDELYFSLRLALCELILPEESSPPIVLDDAFVNFDEERLSRALLLLKELSRKRQIILFSCHEREAAFFKNDSEVNIINL